MNNEVANTTTTTTDDTNAQVLEKIKALTAERKAKRDAVVQAVDKLWADYVEWREKEYRPTREGLLQKLTDNHLARLARREERQKEALEKAEAKKLAAEKRLAALKEASTAGDVKPAEDEPAAEAPAAKPKKAKKTSADK